MSARRSNDALAAELEKFATERFSAASEGCRPQVVMRLAAAALREPEITVTDDSLTARSSEITEAAVEAACQAYCPDRIGEMKERHGTIFVWSHSTAMRAALQAAEATRREA